MTLRSSSLILHETGMTNRPPPQPCGRHLRSCAQPVWSIVCVRLHRFPWSLSLSIAFVYLLSEQQDIATALPCCTIASPQVVFFVVASSPSWLCPQLHCCTHGVHGLRLFIKLFAFFALEPLPHYWIIGLSPDHLDLPPRFIQHNLLSGLLLSPTLLLSISSTPTIVGYIVIFYPHRSMHCNHHRGLLC